MVDEAGPEGVSSENAAAWRSDSVAAEIDRVLSEARRRRRIGLVVSVLAIAIWFFTLAGSIFGGGLATLASVDWSSNSLGPDLEEHGAGLDGPLVLLMPLVAYAIFFVLPLLFLLPIALLFAARWRHPLRIVVFRPFNAAYDRRLTLLLSRSAAGFGHLFTLADRHIAPPWNVRVPLLIGQMALAHFSMPMQRTRADIERLVARLSHRRAITIGWLLSFRKVFPIRTADPVWEECVGAILDEADFVLIDISSRSRSVAFEIERTLQAGLADRFAFLCRADDAVPARLWLETLGHPHIGDQPIFTYRKRLDDASEFARRLAAMSVEAVRHRRRSPGMVSATLRRISATTLGLIALAIALGAPYLLPGQLAAWSPLDIHLLHAFVYRGSQDALHRLDARSHAYTVAALKHYATRSSPQVGAMGMLGLGRVGDGTAVPVILAGWTQRNDAAVAEAVGRIVDRQGEPVFGTVVSAMHDLGTPFSHRLLGRLAGRGGGRPISEVVAGLDDASEGVRFFAAWQLLDSAQPKAIPVLLEMVDWGYVERNWFSSRRVAPLAEKAGERLQKYLDQDEAPVFDAARLDPSLRQSEGRGAYFAVKFARKLGVAPQHLAEVAKQRGDRSAAPLVEAIGQCETSALLADDPVLVELTVPALIAAGSTEEKACTRLGAAKALAVRGRIEALAPALHAANELSWGIVGSHYLDPGSNAVFDELSRTLPRGTRLGLLADDFKGISSASYVALVRLASAMEDPGSLKGAVTAYGNFSGWEVPPIAPTLARSIPKEGRVWVDASAQSAETPHAKERYGELAAELAKLPAR